MRGNALFTDLTIYHLWVGDFDHAEEYKEGIFGLVLFITTLTPVSNHGPPLCRDSSQYRVQVKCLSELGDLVGFSVQILEVLSLVPVSL